LVLVLLPWSCGIVNAEFSWIIRDAQISLNLAASEGFKCRVHKSKV